MGVPGAKGGKSDAEIAQLTATAQLLGLTVEQLMGMPGVMTIGSRDRGRVEFNRDIG